VDLQPDVVIMVLTTYDVDDYVYGALTAGAAGFLLKDAPRAALANRVIGARDTGRGPYARIPRLGGPGPARSTRQSPDGELSIRDF